MRSKYERAAHKQLEAEGYKVDYKIRPRMNPRGYQVDYFGLFDLMAYKPGSLRFIAIKGTMGAPSSLKRAIQAFDAPVQKEIWRYQSISKHTEEIC